VEVVEVPEKTLGTVLRFDQIKGYGFIAPRDGGDDVFMHANDLLDEKSLFETGATVEFVLEHEERGPKASFVQLVARRPQRSSGGAGARGPASAARLQDSEDDGFVDIVAKDEFLTQITELLLALQPSLTGTQILAVRKAVLGYCTSQEWVA
jgi:cold shock CspA family protein